MVKTCREDDIEWCSNDKMEVSGHWNIERTKLKQGDVQKHEGERITDRRSTRPENLENENLTPTTNRENTFEETEKMQYHIIVYYVQSMYVTISCI